MLTVGCRALHVIDWYRWTSWYWCFLQFGLWDALGPSGRARMEHLRSLHRGKWCCWPDTCLKIWYSGAFVVGHRWSVMGTLSLLSLSFEVGDACFAHRDAAQCEEQKARTICCQHVTYLILYKYDINNISYTFIDTNEYIYMIIWYTKPDSRSSRAYNGMNLVSHQTINLCAVAPSLLWNFHYCENGWCYMRECRNGISFHGLPLLSCKIFWSPGACHFGQFLGQSRRKEKIKCQVSVKQWTLMCQLWFSLQLLHPGMARLLRIVRLFRLVKIASRQVESRKQCKFYN